MPAGLIICPSGCNRRAGTRASGNTKVAIGCKCVPKPPTKPRPPSGCARRNAADLDALDALEHRVFATDHLSRRSLRHFLGSPTAEVMVAEQDGDLAGTAIVLFRPRSSVARLYSIAVAPHMGGRGVGPMLLAAAEAAAVERGLRHHPAGGARDQRGRDLALPQERLPRVRPPCQLLRGRRRRAALREAAGAGAGRRSSRRRPISIRAPNSPAGRPAS